MSESNEVIQISHIKTLSNQKLVSQLKSKVLEERKLLNEVLELLHEVSSRKLHLVMAYPTLFEFCVGELNYSRAAAYRRVEALKLINSLPQKNQQEIKIKIQEGSLNLTHLTQVQSFFKAESKVKEKIYSHQEKTEILQKIENKSKLETEKELVKISPQSVLRQQEAVRYLNENTMEVKLTIHADLMEKLNRLKSIKSHINPSMTTAELIEILANQEIKRLGAKAAVYFEKLPAGGQIKSGQ